MTEPRDLNDPALRDRAVAAARGDAPFDLLIRGGLVADVAMQEVRPADIGITGPLIASVHAPGARTDAAETLDAAGLTIAPGLIDAHMHVESSMVTPAVYAAAVLPRGTTTVVWDPHEFGNVAGIPGVDWALAEAARSPLRILPLAPSCVPSAPGYETAGADFGPAEIEALLARPGIHGLAEVMDMEAVTSRAPRMRGIVQAGLASGKPVCGHARGLTGAALQAYAAAGVTSDHELTSAEDLLEKLRAGLWIELRGSHPHLLPEIAQALAALPACPPTLTLCTDDVFPDDLLETGGLDALLRRLVAEGLPPLRALQAATFNAAQRLNRPDLGLVAPGRRADLALFRDLTSFEAAHVLRDGRPPAAPEAAPRPDFGAPSLPRFTPADFETPAAGPSARIAAIDRPRFTQWSEREVPVADGRLAPPPDVTRIAVIHRHGRAPATPRVGFLTNWGSWRGAFATTVSHDSHNLTVFGHDPRDLAAAANALIEAGGGMAVAQGGKVTALLPLPVAGLVSDAPLAEVAKAFRQVREAMDAVVDWQPPYLVFKALVGATLACNAGPHQTDMGVADPHGGRLLTSPILEDGLA
ncbi:adenine deaminase C-terminal domain-containing protein [Albimonas sp. CAU 1670]|uniref:adenine deaminase n=1 Tax=Albimonas sp. CAU 1670 TaxID=3032599 RepID=UPI0023DC8C57|nr:adenine deaminase C-terminal domain-containing protein [Albimonas sp. CAU 1670]MDF2234135.1 adenine deaminase C-terminal domain-containing protein [Albimonas sp. CAU 1670]